jgi:hypothetical protein
MHPQAKNLPPRGPPPVSSVSAKGPSATIFAASEFSMVLHSAMGIIKSLSLPSVSGCCHYFYLESLLPARLK